MKRPGPSRHRSLVARLIVTLSVGLAISGCFEPPCESASEPGGPLSPCAVPGADGGRPDAGAPDAGRGDAGSMDAGRPDAGSMDAGFSDAGVFDAGVGDGGGGVRVIDFGVVSFDDAGLSRVLAFPVDAADEGFQVEVLGSAGSADIFQVTRLLSPRGAVLASGRDFFMHRSRSRPDFGLTNALVLESDDVRAEWVPGSWRFQVESWQPTPASLASVKVYVKPRPAPGPQRLGVNLFFSGSAGLTAASAPTQARLAAGLRAFQRLFADAGITLEPPRYADLPAGFSAVTALIDEDGGAPRMGKSLDALMRQSQGAPLGMNLFFVESLDLFPGLPPGAVLGVAGGIPGSTMTNGTVASGVAILFDAPAYVPRMGEPDPLGLVLAHEVAHQLGVGHVFESTGQLDNLSDTPTSGAAAEANVMSPFAAGGSAWSPLQRVTLRRNPVVRP
ncbi:MAG: hypothetical protein INH37_23605 [Myxococcaceae bacterium]|nr:hypothetical protein [Myxococcaceae bacterium]